MEQHENSIGEKNMNGRKETEREKKVVMKEERERTSRMD